MRYRSLAASSLDDFDVHDSLSLRYAASALLRSCLTPLFSLPIRTGIL